jgi:hypothetical protein
MESKIPKSRPPINKRSVQYEPPLQSSGRKVKRPPKLKAAPPPPAESRALAIRRELQQTEGICGAIKADGTLCNRKAGWSTDHPGEGPCKIHGGNLAMPGTSKYGKRVAALDFYIELATDPEIKRLDEEIAIIRYRLEDTNEMLQDLREGGAALPSDPKKQDMALRLIKQANDLADTVGKLVNRKHQIEEGKIATFKQVQDVLAQIVMIIKKNCDGCPTLDRVAEEFRRVDVSRFEP